MNQPKIPNPKVFISYAWTSETYINKVASFANSLMQTGIDVLFDKFEMKPGNELNDFMEKSVKDPSVTHVLLLLNKTYQEKADKREGGVGKETQILSEELYNNVNQTKIIPVIFEKGPNNEIYKPTYLGSTYFVDLADADRYDTEFALLVKSIYGETVYRKPELGKTPSWVTEAITFEPKTKLQFASLKNQTNPVVNAQNFVLFLDSIKVKILEYKTDGIDRSDPQLFYEKYLDKYANLLPIRDEYLELIRNSVYIDSSEQKIASFFENVFEEIKNLTMNNKELLSIWLHEIFIYTIAYFLKLEQYDKVAYFLGKTYCVRDYAQTLSSFSAFYSTNHEVFDTAVRTRDDKRYYTGVGNYWIENIKTDFCTKRDFTLADIICFNYYLFGDRSDLYIHWFPITYVYGSSRISGENVLKKFAEKLKTREFLKNIITLFNFNSQSDFITQYKKVEKQFRDGELREYRYQESFDSAPLLCHYTKSEDIGKYR
ncbi:MAG: toll/interleukin-1 receptor domain-containing protein [Clostridia bacterium]|nr:toll/interleukin-1 receptor domain-containing protein [Clostridia bacterium]